jgi:hypothetical protein
LDEIYRREIAAWREMFRQRENSGRAMTDIAKAAHAATFGAVETILVDIDEVIPGRIDDQGAVSFAARSGDDNYGVVDEIATRVLATGGRVIGVRKADVPVRAIACRGSALCRLAVHHSGFDVLIPSHSRMGKLSGGKRISMLRATPGRRRMKPLRSRVTII